jgi:hypothetical protein
MPPIKLTEKEIIDFVIAQKNEAKDTREEIEDTWNNLEALYLGNLDWSDAEDWQFKVNPGMVWRTVKNAMAVLSRILTNSPNYFSIEGVEFNQDQPLAEAIEKDLKFCFTQAGREIRNNKQSFISEWREGAESSILFGFGSLKWGIRANQDFLGRLYAEPCCQAIDPRDHLFPLDQSFDIHSYRKPLSDLKKEAMWGRYDKGRITKLSKGDYYGTSTLDDWEERMDRLNLKHVVNEYRREVHIDEYWGDILTREGDIVAENQRIIIANERHLLKKGDNPYECKRRPFVTLNPLRVLFRHLGAGIFDQCEGHQVALTRLINLLLDSELFRIMPVLEGNVNIVDDEEDLYTWEPGKVIPKKSAEQALTPVLAGGSSQGGQALAQFLRQDTQNHTAVSEWIMPAGDFKGGSPTATEVAQKTGQANAYFEQVAKDLEDQGIVQSVKLAADLRIQCLSIPGAVINRAARIYQQSGVMLDQLAQDPMARAEIYGSWDIKARGISLFFEKQESLKGLLQLGELIMKAPPEAQQLVKIDGYFRRTVDALQISNPDEIVKSEEEIAQEQAQAQLQQEILMALGERLGIVPQQQMIPESGGMAPDQVVSGLAQSLLGGVPEGVTVQ